MNAPIRIRPMAARDLDRVMAIEQTTFSTPWTLSTFRGLLARADSRLYVAEASDGDGVQHTLIAGYAVFWRVAQQAELGDLAVDPGWRRRGIGAALLTHVMNQAAQLGVQELFLEVRESNTGARSLYDRFGFRVVGRRTGYYSAPREDALVLLRGLQETGPGQGQATRTGVEAG